MYIIFENLQVIPVFNVFDFLYFIIYSQIPFPRLILKKFVNIQRQELLELFLTLSELSSKHSLFLSFFLSHKNPYFPRRVKEEKQNGNKLAPIHISIRLL